MRNVLICFIIFILPTSVLKAQNQKSIWSFEGGYLNGWTTIKRSPGNLLGTSEYYSKPGFYCGIVNEFVFTKKILIKSEASYQNKGEVYSIIKDGNVIKKSIPLSDASISERITLIFLKRIGISTGPELNILVDRNVDDRRFKGLEFGIYSGFDFRMKRIILSTSYFKSFTPYYEYGSGNQYLKYYNNNWRLGVSYKLIK